jgi:3-keto-L-gulonate-6-phosphate decarboxylase
LSDARFDASAASGPDRVSSTVAGSLTVTVVTDASEAAATAAVAGSLILSSENFTSAASSAEPSANVTPAGA